MALKAGDVMIRKRPGVSIVSFAVVLEDDIEPDGDVMGLDDARARATRTIAETNGRIHEIEDETN